MDTRGLDVPILTIDLNKLDSLSFTLPVSYRFYRHSKIAVESWRELYGEVIKFLCQKHPFLAQAGDSASGFRKEDIGDLKASKSMKAPYLIKRGIYLETGISTDSMIRKIKAAMLSGEMDLSHLQIEYYVDEARKNTYVAQREKALASPKYPVLRWNYNVSYTGTTPISFRYRKARYQNVQTWTGLYVRVITLLARDYPRIIKDGVIFGNGKRIDVSRANRRNNSMLHPVDIGNNLVLETFGSSTQLIDRIYVALTMCKVEPDELIVTFTFGDADQNLAYIGKRVNNSAAPAEVSKPEKKLANRLRFVLGKYFKEGYRLDSSIDRARLYSFFEKQYKEEIPIGEDEIDKVLLTIAKAIDGKILIMKQAAIEALINDIVATISDTFKEGATCIYTFELMKKYQDQLNENGIHDIAPFETLIMDALGNEYKIHYSRICFGRRQPDIRGEVRNYMKNNPAVLSLDELTTRFWYFPETLLEKSLKSAEDIVLVAPEEYYYAPNIPIRNAERINIESSLRTLLLIRHEITEIELLETVLQTCPQLLSEVAGLSWDGLKGSFEYLFRNTLMFNGYKVMNK